VFLTRPDFEPRNARQREAADEWQRSQCLILHGPAGTGKTCLAVAFALQHLADLQRRQGRVVESADPKKGAPPAHRLYLCRPARPAGEDIGFLPGTDREKVAPYLHPLHDALRKFGVDPERAWREKLLEEVPVAFLQGRNFEGVAVLDEAQNCSAEQLATFVTRQNPGAKLVISGDPAQHYGPHRNVFDEAVARLGGVPGVGVVRFTPADIVRHPIVARYLEALAGL
jgi:phosphate starvation-inducible PhoH-like protein